MPHRRRADLRPLAVLVGLAMLAAFAIVNVVENQASDPTLVSAATAMVLTALGFSVDWFRRGPKE